MFLREQNFNILVVSHQSVFRHCSMLENYIEGSVQSFMDTRDGHVGKLDEHQENGETGFVSHPLVLEFRRLLYPINLPNAQRHNLTIFMQILIV